MKDLDAEDLDGSSGFRRSMILFHHPFQVFANNRRAGTLLTKGLRKTNFAELALRFGSDLADPIEQNYRNSWLFRGFCEGIGQRWPEAEMPKCSVIFSQALR